jgi:uncharacterized protein
VALRIEETFQLRAPPARVWAYLTDPRQVVTCLPGAELTSVEDESTFLGKVKVKVGPVVAAYSGKVTITERDEGAGVVRIVGEGRESAGAGSAKMTMTSTLVARPDGGTEVRVTADLDIVGRIAQFGRGMIESVNRQMFKQFTECVRATLETAEPAEPPAAAEPDTPVPLPADGEAATAVETRAAPQISAHAPPAPVTSAPALDPAPAASQPVRLLPVLFAALWDLVHRALRRFWQTVAWMFRRGVG